MLPPDDINVADVVTVLSGRPLECPCGCGTVMERSAGHKGIPLCVVAVDLPYLMTRPVFPGGPVVIVDIREVDLKRCSESYWKAFAGVGS